MYSNVKDVQAILRQWGSWWRNQGCRESRETPDSIGQRLIMLARLGISPERKVRQVQRAHLVVPDTIEEIDKAVQELPDNQRAMVYFWYVQEPETRRAKFMKSNPRECRILLQSEMALMEAL